MVTASLNVHKAADLRKFARGREWLTIYDLPPYAPDLNPVEGIWSLLRPDWLSSVAFSTTEHLIQRIRRGLRHIQYRSDLIDGCLAETGLTTRSSGFGTDTAVVMPWWLWALVGAVFGVLLVAIVKNIRDAGRLAKANR